MTAPRTDRGPGVGFPPPIVYAIPFLAGWGIHQLLPLPIHPDDPDWLDALGLVLVATWFVLFTWAFWTLVSLGAAVRPDRPTTVLVTTGPYAFSRNPIYLAFNALYLGLALVVNSVWPLLGFPLVWFALHREVIGKEEKYLAGMFGEKYEEYRKRVRRWV